MLWFGGIVQDLIARDPLVVVDQQVATWLHEHATPALTRAAEIVTAFGSPAFLTGASLALALYFLLQRAWRHLLALVLTMGGGSLLNVALKSLFQRERPVFENPIITLSSYSFPSGHTMGATLFYGFLTVFVVTHTRRLRWRVMAFLLAFLIVVLIGFTRIYLGAHYLSDVMGAMAAGLAWLTFCVTAAETLRRYRALLAADY
jgi:membrane-associated phospholipid phosphatase